MLTHLAAIKWKSFDNKGVTMGLFWDLMQESAIAANREKADTLEGRVRELERDLATTNQRLDEVIKRLEKQSGEDLNNDGLIG